MNIEVGEYVRTFNGEIAKIIGTDIEFDCKVYKTDQYIQSSRDFYVFENDSGIVNHSKNIIDLREAGDYVDGSKILEVRKRENRLIVEIYRDTEQSISRYLTNENIRSIVTKEQFRNMEYRL